MMNQSEFLAHTEQIEQLVQRVNELPNQDARTIALELLQSLMDLHAAAFDRIVEVLSEGGESGRNSLSKLSNDPLISGLMVLYGVHPASLEERVDRAIEKVRRRLQKQVASVELVGIAGGAVRVSVRKSGQGCGSSTDALRLAVEQAILEAAPEVVQVVVEDIVPSAFIPANMIQPVTKEEQSYEESKA